MKKFDISASSNIKQDIENLFDLLIKEGLPQNFELWNFKDLPDKKRQEWIEISDEYVKIGLRIFGSGHINGKETITLY